MQSLPRRFLVAALACAAQLAAHAVNFAVNEGATYRVADSEIQQKYKSLADEMEKTIGQKVTVVPVADYKELADGLASGKFEIAYVHPAHLALKAIAVDGYSVVALTKGFTDYKASFLVRPSSPVKAPADLRGRKLGAPSPDSITAVLMRTTLREVGAADQASVVNTRFQDAIPFMVENGLVDVGVTGSDSVARAWTAAGNRVAFTSKPVPVKIVIASSRIAASDVAKLQAQLIGLEQSDKGRQVLQAIDKKGFVAGDPKALTALHQWVSAGTK